MSGPCLYWLLWAKKLPPLLCLGSVGSIEVSKEMYMAGENEWLYRGVGKATIFSS